MAIPTLVIESVSPNYNLYRFTPNRYKVTYWPAGAPSPRTVDRSRKGNESKLSQSVSRAKRVILELALCNEWKWFCTFTIAKDNFDRSNLQDFYKRFRGFIKYQREKFGKAFKYVLIPEQHGDGSWHMHGFFTDDVTPYLKSFKEMDDEGYRSAEGRRLPRKLISKNYYNWEAYQEKFGFCSFGEIRNKDAVSFYVVKYINKSLEDSCDRVGLRLYYPSEGLNRAEFYDSIYGYSSDLNACLTDKFQWCSTGFITFDKDVGYDPVADFCDERRSWFVPLPVEYPQAEKEVDDYYNFTQMFLEGFR